MKKYFSVLRGQHFVSAVQPWYIPPQNVACYTAVTLRSSREIQSSIPLKSRFL